MDSTWHSSKEMHKKIPEINKLFPGIKNTNDESANLKQIIV